MGDEEQREKIVKEDIKKDLKRRLTSRKLHVAVIGFIAATLFFYFGMLSGALWVELVRWLFALYAAGNVGEHMADAAKSRIRGSRRKRK